MPNAARAERRTTSLSTTLRSLVLHHSTNPPPHHRRSRGILLLLAFSPALEQFSTKLGLPPRFAGVTLLALGNGAPDVSATISAIRQGGTGYQLSLGALTGAGMFVGTVVAGVVMLIAGGVKARGALIRDLSMYVEPQRA